MKHKCKRCHKKTQNAVFCSSSCAASYNNHRYPKRVRKLKLCKGCGVRIEPHRKWCDKCLPKFFRENGARHAKRKSTYVRLNLAYRKDELKTKRRLDKRYRTTFCKERVGRRYIDYADESKLIEHTKDGTHGLQDVIARFSDVERIGDSRARIAFIDTGLLGPVRRSRLQKLRVKIVDFRVLIK